MAMDAQTRKQALANPTAAPAPEGPSTNPGGFAASFVPGLVSVIVPTYNCEKVLGESIASVVGQTYQNWELLVVNDHSKDGTLAVAQDIASSEQRIRVIDLSQNGGVANARNVGMRAARGQYLAFLDSDDIWLPNKLDSQTEFMQKNDVGFSFCRYRRFYADGRVGSIVRIPKVVGYQRLLRQNVIGCLTVMIDRTKVAPFTMRPGGYEDYFAWLQILKCGHLAWGLQKDLARYRVSTNSISSNKLHSTVLTWKTYRNLEKLPLPKALWCIGNYMVRSVYSRLLDAISF